MEIPKPPPGYKSVQPDTGPDTQPAPQPTKPREFLKAYVDVPDGKKNERRVYRTHNLDHSTNLLSRLIRDGYRIRSAYHQHESGVSNRIDVEAKSARVI